MLQMLERDSAMRGFLGGEAVWRKAGFSQGLSSKLKSKRAQGLVCCAEFGDEFIADLCELLDFLILSKNREGRKKRKEFSRGL